MGEVFRIDVREPGTAAALLAAVSGLSRTRVKDAMSKGAAWLTRVGARPRRVRRATTAVKAGDRLELCYDARILDRAPATPRLVYDAGAYSAWDKPAGILAQGSRWGDHLALTRRVELARERSTPVLLVHRLDREASGLMLLARTRAAAAALSAAFRDQRIEKTYRAVVRGDVASGLGRAGVLDAPVDGRAARTRYRVLECIAEPGGGPVRSLLEVVIETGRRHQIRRHLAGIGFPVLGDPRYGSGNADPDGLALRAVGLGFACPLTGERRTLEVAPGPRFEPDG